MSPKDLRPQGIDHDVNLPALISKPQNGCQTLMEAAPPGQSLICVEERQKG